jgi:hypothetical protein
MIISDETAETVGAKIASNAVKTIAGAPMFCDMTCVSRTIVSDTTVVVSEDVSSLGALLKKG